MPNDQDISPERGRENSRFYLRAGLGVIVLGTIFHLLYSTHLELVGDEAYYWLWSRHPDICYLDKGPMVAWFIAAGTALFGHTVFGVRFFAVILAGGTGVAILLLARQLFSERAAFWAMVAASVIPLFAVGSSLMTIDTVYVFFWSWAALAFWWAKDRRDLGPWILTGALVGLGLLSKYTAALEIVSFLVFCLWDRPSRVHLRGATFWVMLLTAVLFLTPAVVWNIQHDWPTSNWLLRRGGLQQARPLRPGFALAFLGAQAGVFSPFYFVGLIFAFCRPWLWQKPQPASGYAAALFLPLFGLYFFLSFRYVGQPNWTAAAYVGGVILLAAKWLEVVRRHPWTRWLVGVALVLAAAETIALLDTRWLHLSAKRDPLDRARGSRNLAAAVAKAQQESGAQFVVADNYMTAALLSFYLPGQPETFVPLEKKATNQMEVWPNFVETFPAANGLVVSKHKNLSASLQRNFEAVKFLGPVEVIDGERKIGTYRFYLGRGSQRTP